MNKATNNHKYRLSIYLGKDTYQKIEQLACQLSLPMATATRVILETGLQVSSFLERGIKANESKQPKE